MAAPEMPEVTGAAEPAELVEAPLGAPSGSGFADTPPPKPARSPGGWKMWAVVGLTIVIIVGAVAYTALGSAGAKRVVLIKNGSGVDIPAGSYYSASVHLSSSGTMSGSVVSADGIVLYVMDSSTYATFQTTGVTANVTWTSGVIHNMTFQVTINAGTWELVFAAPNPYLPTEFLATSDLVVSS